MAARKPLVLKNGRPAELSASDNLTLDFGNDTTGTVSIARGGTGAITAPLARAALGVVESVGGDDDILVSTTSRVVTARRALYGNRSSVDALTLPPYPKHVPGGVFAANVARGFLLYLPMRFSLRRISFWVQTPGAAGATVELGLYNTTSLLYSTGDVGTTTGGFKSGAVVTAINLPPGTYHLFAQSNSTAVQLQAQDCDISGLGVSANLAYTMTTAGALPATLTTTDVATNNFFIIQLRSG